MVDSGDSSLPGPGPGPPLPLILLWEAIFRARVTPAGGILAGQDHRVLERAGGQDCGSGSPDRRWDEPRCAAVVQDWAG